MKVVVNIGRKGFQNSNVPPRKWVIGEQVGHEYEAGTFNPSQPQTMMVNVVFANTDGKENAFKASNVMSLREFYAHNIVAGYVLAGLVNQLHHGVLETAALTVGEFSYEVKYFEIVWRDDDLIVKGKCKFWPSMIKLSWMKLKPEHLERDHPVLYNEGMAIAQKYYACELKDEVLMASDPIGRTIDHVMINGNWCIINRMAKGLLGAHMFAGAVTHTMIGQDENKSHVVQHWGSHGNGNDDGSCNNGEGGCPACN